MKKAAIVLILPILCVVTIVFMSAWEEENCFTDDLPRDPFTANSETTFVSSSGEEITVREYRPRYILHPKDYIELNDGAGNTVYYRKPMYSFDDDPADCFSGGIGDGCAAVWIKTADGRQMMIHLDAEKKETVFRCGDGAVGEDIVYPAKGGCAEAERILRSGFIDTLPKAAGRELCRSCLEACIGKGGDDD